MVGISKTSTLRRIAEHKQMISTARREIVYSTVKKSPYYERSDFVYIARTLKNIFEIPARYIGIGFNKAKLALIGNVQNVAEKKGLKTFA